jgi:Mor family transcriptional regulator
VRRGKPRTSEIVQRLADIGTMRLTEDAGMDADRARFIMREIAHTLCQEYGGNEFYMPKDTELALDKRDLRIWERFNGQNTWQLATEFGLTERQIRYICAVMRKRAAALNQLDLPGLDTPE